ncbi:hypothetical protein [Methylobacterium iners]|uniref:Uncharacterized protein n=1 Tax=Methylobacterium iners TaxID=418707 RepID=A0ABQ4RVI0_9HYPH|nr:hypothetical protein [Methylobacterium iners]GJD94601.1 hypothetical protein OCOJLMKI_1804 [Methylobacterium iners]
MDQMIGDIILWVLSGIRIWLLFGIPFAVILGLAIWQLVKVRRSIRADRGAAVRDELSLPDR